MKGEKVWWEVTSTFDYCKITGVIISVEKPNKPDEQDKCFDYFESKSKADEFVRGF